MSKPHKRRGNPDFRHFVVQQLSPAIQSRLDELLQAGWQFSIVNSDDSNDKYPAHFIISLNPTEVWHGIHLSNHDRL